MAASVCRSVGRPATARIRVISRAGADIPRQASSSAWLSSSGRSSGSSEESRSPRRTRSSLKYGLPRDLSYTCSTSRGGGGRPSSRAIWSPVASWSRRVSASSSVPGSRRRLPSQCWKCFADGGLVAVGGHQGQPLTCRTRRPGRRARPRWPGRPTARRRRPARSGPRDRLGSSSASTTIISIDGPSARRVHPARAGSAPRPAPPR